MTRVLIAGASIAGPALAFWLDRCGFATTVVEKSPAQRPGGQAVDLRGVAREVAARMGLDQQIRDAAIHTAGFSTVDAAGAPLSSQRADEHGGDGQIAEIEILRGDLADVLISATRGTTEYVFGESVTELTERGNVIDVGFASGARREFDLVIGADGLHSAVRALLFGEETQHLLHLGTYIAFWSAPNHLGLEDWALDHTGDGCSTGIRPVHGNSETIVYIGFQSDRLTYDHRDVVQQKAIIRDRAAGVGWEAPRLLAEMDDAPDFYFDSCSQVLLDTWSRGRTGLLGDAAYSPSPLTGQGTSLALVRRTSWPGNWRPPAQTCPVASPPTSSGCASGCWPPNGWGARGRTTTPSSRWRTGSSCRTTGSSAGGPPPARPRAGPTPCVSRVSRHLRHGESTTSAR